MSIFNDSSYCHLADEVTRLSGNPNFPVLVNAPFLRDLKKHNLVDYDPSAPAKYVMKRHPLTLDPSAPYYHTVQYLVDYNWDLNGTGTRPNFALCGCKLNGAHELWCDQWQPY